VIAFSPTAGTATAGSTPDFCRKRTFSAIPPTIAGASVPANDAAICAMNVGTSRRRSGTDPITPSVAPKYVSIEASTTGRNQIQSAASTWSMIPGRLATCGSRK
jgi:hypothetical protein